MTEGTVEDDLGTFFGLDGIDIGDAPIAFPRGIMLRKTYAYLMQPAIMAFTPAAPGRHHPGPWKETRGGGGRTISTELFIPNSAAPDKRDRVGLAYTIILLLKLWILVNMLISVQLQRQHKLVRLFILKNTIQNRV